MPFVCCYGPGTCVQLLKDWVYPDIARWWLFGAKKPEDLDDTPFPKKDRRLRNF